MDYPVLCMSRYGYYLVKEGVEREHILRCPNEFVKELVLEDHLPSWYCGETANRML
jgi:hypothetical protein